MAHLYRVCQPACLDNTMCFQIFGFDFLIDSDFKPWLLEVNGSPSWRFETSLDYGVKKNVLADTFRLLNLDLEKKKKFVRKHKTPRDGRSPT